MSSVLESLNKDRIKTIDVLANTTDQKLEQLNVSLDIIEEIRTRVKYTGLRTAKQFDKEQSCDLPAKSCEL